MPQAIDGHVVKNIISGAVITSFIFAISVFLPIVGFFSAVLIPLPILFYRGKLGRFPGSTVPLLTAVIIWTILGGSAIDSLFFIGLMFTGFMLGELLELNLSIEKTIGYTCAAVLAAGFAVLFFYSIALDTTVIEMISVYVLKNLEITLALYKHMGIPTETIHQVEDSLESIQYALVRIAPSLLLVSILFVSWTSLLFARPIFRSFALPYPDFGKLTTWSTPEKLVWGAIGCGVALMLPSTEIKLIGLNGILILMMIYFLHGIAIVAYFVDKKKFPRIARTFIYSLIAIQQIFTLMVIGLGFFDLWVNFRKLDKQ
ncbi:MAG: YybS family protein [Deltaproteobacteria bacterium]|nr:YybS family protein [Deltaproteobacteria bacterium]